MARQSGFKSMESCMTNHCRFQKELRSREAARRASKLIYQTSSVRSMVRRTLGALVFVIIVLVMMSFLPSS